MSISRARKILVMVERLLIYEEEAEAALPLLETAAKLEPTGRTLAWLALCRQKQRRQEARALVDARAAAALAPEDPVVQSALGCALTLNWQPGEACAAFARSLAIDPTNAAVWFNRGVTRIGASQFAEAVGDLLRAMALAGSGYSPLRHSLIHWEVLTADDGLARLPKMASAAAPADAPAFAVLCAISGIVADDAFVAPARGRFPAPFEEAGWVLAYARRRQRSHLRGTRLLDRLVARNPQDSVFRWARAQSLTVPGFADPRVREDLDFLVERHPRSPAIREERATAWSRALQPDRALSELEAWRELEPDTMEPLAFSAAVLERMERMEEAIEFRSRLVELYAPDGIERSSEYSDLKRAVPMLGARAECLERLGRFDQAEADLARAIRCYDAKSRAAGAGRGFSWARVEHARFLVRRERFREALAEIEECIESDPSIAGLYTDRADCRERLGDAAGAEADRKRAQGG